MGGNGDFDNIFLILPAPLDCMSYQCPPALTGGSKFTHYALRSFFLDNYSILHIL